MEEGAYYEKINDNKVKCGLCPHGCVISPGKFGFCRIRKNEEGSLVLPFYGRISGLADDPIEKKPLYHFHPGKTILSAGFWGCNFRCPFCQNYQISQYTSVHGDVLSPAHLAKMAKQHGSFGIAYTYSEPLVHFEYILEAAKEAHKLGLKNVLVSNGCISPEPAAELLDYLDAANIDLKSFNPGFYKDELKGDLETVKAFITEAAKKISLEVTTLVIPGKNDSEDELRQIAGFIGNLDKNIPLHLSCYYPTYKYTVNSTPSSEVFELAKVAGEYLNFVYPGNVGLREVNTNCPSCGKLLVRRRGYSTEITGVKEGHCAGCGEAVPIRGV